MENKIINVNSIFRDTSKYPKPTNFRIDLNDTIRNIMYIKVTSLEMGNVNYTFSDFRNNNSFSITTAGGTDTINLGSGNFTSSILTTNLQDILDEINTARGTDINVSIQVTSGKLLFTCSTSITINFTRTGSTQYKGVKYYLGFNNDSYTGTSISADSVLNVGGVNYFYMRLNNLDNINDHMVSDVFLKIISDVDKYNTVFLNGGDYNSKDMVFRSPIDLSYLEIQLVDYLGNELEFNNFDFSFTIEVGYVYDYNLYKKLNNKGEPDGDNRLKFYYN